MRHIIIALILFSTPAICAAGDSRLLFLAVSPPLVVITSDAIGGERSIYTGGVTDSGTGTATGTGTVSVTATCDATGSSGTSGVYLYVNGSLAGSVVCNHGDYIAPTALTASVSGSYTARVYGIATGDSDFTATPFSFPVDP